MAHGHPDYWTYSSPQLAVPGPEQIPWHMRGFSNLAGGAGWATLVYTVLAGQRLYIASGFVTCDSAFVHRYGLYVGVTAHILASFDSNIQFPILPSSLVVVNAGVTVSLQVTNLDVVVHRFDAGAYGFLVTIVPGAVPPVGLGLLVAGAGV